MTIFVHGNLWKVKIGRGQLNLPLSQWKWNHDRLIKECTFLVTKWKFHFHSLKSHLELTRDMHFISWTSLEVSIVSILEKFNYILMGSIVKLNFEDQWLWFRGCPVFISFLWNVDKRQMWTAVLNYGYPCTNLWLPWIIDIWNRAKHDVLRLESWLLWPCAKTPAYTTMTEFE